jgi:hypothetical protein
VFALSEVLGDPTPTSSGELSFPSPFTHKFKDPNSFDTKKHLYVNMSKGVFCDFKSGQSGTLSYLAFLIGADLEAAPRPRLDPLDELKSKILQLGCAAEFVRPTADLPEWFQPVVPGSDVQRYLVDRGVTREDIAYYGIGEGSGDHRSWVVLPSLTRHGKCEYWVSRNVNKKAYRNPQVDRRHHVCFLEKALDYSPGEVVVCEGIFSAIAAGRDAVAALGKLVTDSQLRTMLQAGVRRVTLALDGDAWKETLDTAERCLKIGLDARVVPLPRDKDPDDLGREQFRFLVDNCAQDVDDLSLVKLRML